MSPAVRSEDHLPGAQRPVPDPDFLHIHRLAKAHRHTGTLALAHRHTGTLAHNTHRLTQTGKASRKQRHLVFRASGTSRVVPGALYLAPDAYYVGDASYASLHCLVLIRDRILGPVPGVLINIRD